METLNRPEQLSRQDLLAITGRFQARGVTQIMLSGGEPMLRLDDVLVLCRAEAAGTEYWIATSGHRLDAEAARRLAEAGLTGVYISMDHFEPDRHDAFRGRPGSFRQAWQAARSVREADLVLCLSLCPTREFVSRQNLERYAGLATELGAGFIQILDPRAAGRWEGEDVALSPKQNALLDDFYLTLNRDPASSQLPAVIYHGYYQRRQSCLGAGKRFLFREQRGRSACLPLLLRQRRKFPGRPAGRGAGAAGAV